MRVLVVDSSQVRAVACLLEVTQSGAQLLFSDTASTSVAASESLLPLIDKVMALSGGSMAELHGFACGVGPGSFTGIRIGLATMKTLAQVWGKPVVTLSSLRALALSSQDSHIPAVAMAKAYQGQVFAGWNEEERSQWYEEATTVDDWIKKHLMKVAKDAVFLGPGADAFAPVLSAAALGDRHQQNRELTAQGLYLAAAEKILGDPIKAWRPYEEVEPQYLRPAQAVLNLAAARQKG